jgi:hypothetical protein
MNKRFMVASGVLLFLAACHDGSMPTDVDAPGTADLGVPPAAPEAALSNAPIGADASPNLFAVVDQNGNLIAGNLVSAVAKVGPGQYEVTFAKDVSQCGYVATTSNAYSQAIIAYTAGGHSGNQGVYVETKNQGGGLTDGPFNLVVSCASSAMPFAVVDYAGNLVRGTAGTAITNLGFGRYNVTFPTSVNSCGYIATVGDPANALVYNPSGVYTGRGPNRQTVYIETKNPGGGLQAGVPFHLVAVCSNTPMSSFAVIRPGGTAAAGSRSVTGVRLSTGNYDITTPRLTGSCAAVATRGSISTAVPFSPATVEIVPGSSPSSVGVQERNLLFFGGALFNESFHVAVVC